MVLKEWIKTAPVEFTIDGKKHTAHPSTRDAGWWIYLGTTIGKKKLNGAHGSIGSLARVIFEERNPRLDPSIRLVEVSQLKFISKPIFDDSLPTEKPIKHERLPNKWPFGTGPRVGDNAPFTQIGYYSGGGGCGYVARDEDIGNFEICETYLSEREWEIQTGFNRRGYGTLKKEPSKKKRRGALAGTTIYNTVTSSYGQGDV